MSYKNVEINPVNYSETVSSKLSQFYRGFSSLDSANHSSKMYDFELVKQDIINHFNTRRGQRLMNPKFGTIIWDMMMEPFTSEVRDVIASDINTIVTSDPRVYPLQIDINEYEQGYLIELTIAMKNTNQSAALRLAFDQKLGLKVL
jgi:phage baseplate assembly protein W